MIAIKLRGDKFRLEIQSEELEFNTRAEMEKVLKYILDLKESNGKLNRE